jgi:DNA replication protein DnaC
MKSSVRDVIMANLAYERLHENLRILKLTTIDEILDNYLEVAVHEGKSTLEVIDYLIEKEKQKRNASLIATRMKYAGFPVRKALDDFDFEFQPSIDQPMIRDLATLKFIYNAENVVLLGPPGVGKTHIAIALGIEAINNGFSVYFINASTLIERLKKEYRVDKLEKLLKKMAKYQLLIIDEMGYLPFDSEAAYCFFQLISRRYEHSSTIFTSNKSYGEWGEIFHDHVIATAILDRILHHCTTINIRGESFRLRERREMGILPRQYEELRGCSE